jgi:hypothetical protein
MDYGQKRILSDHWQNITPTERLAVATALNSTTDTIERHLQLWRKHEQERLEYERQNVLDFFTPSEGPEHPATRPVDDTPAPPVLLGFPRVTLSAAVFDLECTDFGTEGYAGYLICGCILPLDADKPDTIAIDFDEHGDDRRLVKELLAALGKYDIIIGHNVTAFDFNWLRSRWLHHAARGGDVGDWPRRWVVMDTYQAARSTAVKTRKSLGNLGDYFGLEGEKTTIYRTSWNNVRSPYRQEFDATMHNVLYHCGQDVILNRNLFDIMWANSLSMGVSPLRFTKWGHTPAGQGAAA